MVSRLLRPLNSPGWKYLAEEVAEEVQHLTLNQDCHVPTPYYYPYAVQNCIDI